MEHPGTRPKHVAVVGSGIGGLGAAHRLTEQGACVTLFESQPRLGGHTATVDITVGGVQASVDTGFLVFNERTYPRLIALFAALDIPTAASDMSFSFSLDGGAYEWGGASLATVFGQGRNLFSLRHWQMLKDVLRFNALARDLARSNERASGTLTEFLDTHDFSRAFRARYLLPMAAAIWSTPESKLGNVSARALAGFFDQHGLLDLRNRPQWRTVQGGARCYVDRIAAQLYAVKLATPVLRIEREPGAVCIHTANGSTCFDAVVVATHAPQALALLVDADPHERVALREFRTQPNHVVLHTDADFLPTRRALWSAWNVHQRTGKAASDPVSMTYWINRLQPIPIQQPVLVTLNPDRAPRSECLLGEYVYSHPIMDRAARRMQQAVGALQGRRRTAFAGAWLGYGFHEDGLRSGQEAADAVLAALQVGGPR